MRTRLARIVRWFRTYPLRAFLLAVAMFFVGSFLFLPAVLGFDNLLVLVGALVIYASLVIAFLACVAGGFNFRDAWRRERALKGGEGRGRASR